MSETHETPSDLLNKLSTALVQISRGDPLVALRSEFQTQLGAVGTRFDAIDKATALQHEDQVRIPTQIDRAIDGLSRILEAKFQGTVWVVEGKLNTLAAEMAAETRRINELASTRQEFQNTIRDMLAESVRSTSALVSTQLVQIQSTFDGRVTKLEAAQLTQAGRSSVADPATESALRQIADQVARMKTTQDDAMTRMASALGALQTTEGASGGRLMGREASNARMLALVAVLAAVASPIITLLIAYAAMRGH